MNINIYVFGARNYDPALVRTFTIDPLANEFYHISPYSFLNNNPLNNVDPTGALTLTGQAAKDWFQGLKDDIESRPRKNEEDEEFFEDDIKAEESRDGGGCPTPPCNGEIRPDPKTWVDEWAESSNILAQASYGIVNSFSIVGQSLNPFDNEVTSLTGEGLNGTDRSEHGAEVAATLLPIGGGAIGLKHSSSLLKISNPNALARSLPGFTDKVSGSALRQGRGPLIDYPTKQPALRSLNSQKLNKYGQWATGIGLSGAVSYYYYKKTTKKK